MNGYMIEYVDKRTDEITKVFTSEENHMNFLELIKRHSFSYRVQSMNFMPHDGETPVVSGDSYGYIMGYQDGADYKKVFIPSTVFNAVCERECKNGKKLHIEDWTNTLILDKEIPVLN